METDFAQSIKDAKARGELLQAHVKKIENIPEGAKCCPFMEGQYIAWRTSGRRVLVIPPGQPGGKVKKRCTCMQCGAKFKGVPIANPRGWYIDPRAWDIAEAPIAEEPAA